MKILLQYVYFFNLDVHSDVISDQLKGFQERTKVLPGGGLGTEKHLKEFGQVVVGR